MRSRTSSTKPASPSGQDSRIARPVLLGAADGLGDVERLRVLRQLGGAQQRVQLVPLELVGDERRDRVVEVRRRGQQDRERARARSRTSGAAGPGASTASQSSIRPKPARANASDSCPTTITVACQIDAGSRRSAYRNAPEVGRLHVVRERVQARAHRRVRGLEHAQQRLARRAQQRRVRAVVELDLVGGLAQRGTAGEREGREGVGRP